MVDRWHGLLCLWWCGARLRSWEFQDGVPIWTSLFTDEGRKRKKGRGSVLDCLLLLLTEHLVVTTTESSETRACCCSGCVEGKRQQEGIEKTGVRKVVAEWRESSNKMMKTRREGPMQTRITNNLKRTQNKGCAEKIRTDGRTEFIFSPTVLCTPAILQKWACGKKHPSLDIITAIPLRPSISSFSSCWSLYYPHPSIPRRRVRRQRQWRAGIWTDVPPLFCLSTRFSDTRAARAMIHREPRDSLVACVLKGLFFLFFLFT